MLDRNIGAYFAVKVVASSSLVEIDPSVRAHDRVIHFWGYDGYALCPLPLSRPKWPILRRVGC